MAESSSQRIVEAFARLPGYGAVGGWAAAYWTGVRLLDGSRVGDPLDAGLPRPLVNRPVFGLDGALLGLPDILDLEAGTMGEYDGDEHRAIDNHTSDNIRAERCEEYGLVTRVTRLDLRRLHPPPR